MTGRTARSVAVGLLILAGCGDASAPAAGVPAPTGTTDAAVPSTMPPAASAPAETFPSSGPPPPPTTASVAGQATFEVEGVTLTVTLPDGAVPDPRGTSPAPVWAPASGSWLVPECGCSLGFGVQTFVPPRYAPDLVETFDSGALTWNVYDSSHEGTYYLAAADTPDGLAVHVVGSSAPLELIRAVASSVTKSGVRDAPLWDGQLDVDVATGLISAEGFNTFVDTRQPVETRTAAGAALMLVGPDDSETATELSERPGADGRTIVTITKSNLLDDSIHAVRYQIELQQMPDTLFRFIGGKWAQQCQPDRGHQDFTTELCT